MIERFAAEGARLRSQETGGVLPVSRSPRMRMGTLSRA